MNDQTFYPAGYLKNGYLQTLLASSKLRKLGKNKMVEAEKEIILNTGNNIRLQGFFSSNKNHKTKGIVILIHGWEGSAKSSYILATGKYLFENGYSVFRLNLRDHGDSHHLNEGIFYAIILDEVFEAVKQIADMENGKPAFLIGFSLGGNFALRISKRCNDERIENLKHVIAVSPGLNPEVSTDAIDDDKLIQWYFMKKWRKSLKKKENLFPHLYSFDALYKAPSIRKMTDILVENYSDYGNTENYFKGYTLLDNFLKDISVPTTVITAEDDPIIPVCDFRNMQLNGNTSLLIQKHGGHNGFIERLPFSCWYERQAIAIFDSYLN